MEVTSEIEWNGIRVVVFILESPPLLYLLWQWGDLRRSDAATTDLG